MTPANPVGTSLVLRPARPQDASLAVALMHSAAPQLLDHIFTPLPGGAHDWLKHSFTAEAGLFSHRHYLVGEVHGRVVLGLTAYDGALAPRLAAHSARLLAAWATPMALTRILARTFALRALLPTPSPSHHYLANIGVTPGYRGQGLFQAAFHSLCQACPTGWNGPFGTGPWELDVDVQNQGAWRLYQHLGFAITGRNALQRKDFSAKTLRMQRPRQT